MNIRTRLLLLVLAVLIPAFLAATLGIAYVYTETQESNRNTLQETARALALLVENDLETREELLKSFAESPALDSGDLGAFYEHAKRTANDRGSAIVLADSESRVLLNTAEPLGALNIANSGTLQRLRKEQGPEGTVISQLYLSPHRKTHSFAIQVPVRRDGRIRYYVSIGSDASQMQTLLQRQNLPASWIGAIVDRDGTIVARTQEPEKYVGQKAREPIVKGIREQGEGFHDGLTLNGLHTLAAFSRSPKSGWSFVINVPRSELDQAAVRTVTLMAAISLLLLGFGLAGAFAVARRTVGSIESLRASAERLGRGETVGPASYGVREMDAVGAAITHASAEIQAGKAELEQRVEEAVAAAERSQKALLQTQKLDALGRLTGGIAHDFNNVLQTLTSGLQLAQLSSSEQRVRSLLETCERAVNRATELTRQLMAFGRVQDARLETIDLPARLGQVTPLLRGALPSNIDFRMEIADGLWPVTVDPLQFELALLNLAINARDAMPDGGVLRLRAENHVVADQDHDLERDLERGEYVLIGLSDTGIGMSLDTMSKALDPFFTTKAVGSGAGMGLPQAYGFAKQAGGTLLLKSVPGKGTEAMMYLPRNTALPVALAPDSPRTQGSVSEGVLLFVEDDPLVREVMQPALEASGFRVRTVFNGEQALEVLNSGERIDFIFSDIVMPGRVSGIDLAVQVQERHSGIRVVLATGYSDRRVSLPNVKTLAKPYAIDDVVAAFDDS